MNKQILVIDDEVAIRQSFVLALEDMDYSVDTVDSGLEGIEAVKKQAYDLIFLDLKMPGLTGVQTLRELRKLDQQVPVYIVTAFHQEFTDQLRLLQEEDIEFDLLQKPIGSEQIIWITNNLLEEAPIEEIPFLLKLYVAGDTPRSRRAIDNVEAFCKETIPSQYVLDVIDVLLNPQEALKEQIIATPTLVKVKPLPVEKIFGNFSEKQKVSQGLRIYIKKKE
ncbi:response regulator [Deltaproteobacteria bacterium TL4]